MARFGVGAKAFAAIVLVLGFSLVLISLLNYFKYEKTFSALQRSKFEVIARDLKAAAETGMNIGLPLPALKNMQDLISRESHRDNQILNIEIFGTDGTVLYSTQPGRAGATESPKLLDALRHASGKAWELNDKDSFLVGVPINNNFGRLSGGLAIRYAKSYFETELLRIGRELAEYSAIVFGVSVFAAALAVMLMIRGMNPTGENVTGTTDTGNEESAHGAGENFQHAGQNITDTQTVEKAGGRSQDGIAGGRKMASNVVPLLVGKERERS